MTSHERLGTELAGYRIESVIGRGGMSVVYLAEETHLERKVALKLLAPELSEDAKFRERFIRESRLAASLEHPNIITVYEAREVEGQLYIAMRYISGGDLKGLIGREGPLDAERAISILTQAASALDAAHAEGLIHRDVKPGNILLNPRSESMGAERVYLSDFGLTKRATSDSGITATGQFVGTLDYAAPEQFQGKTLDSSTDVYSLGCVLYECLTGEVPYPQENQAALVYAHLMAAPPKVTAKRTDLPPAIDRVVGRAMAKNPEDRYRTAGELVQAVSDALGVDPVLPTTPTRPVPVPPSGPRGSRRQAILVGGGGGLLALIILLVVLLNRGGGPPGGAVLTTGPPAELVDYVARIDPTGRVTERIAVGGDPVGVAIAEGSAWVASNTGNAVSRIDPASGRVTATIKVGKVPIAIASGEGAVWVANLLGKSISKIDPATNEVVATFPFDRRPQAMTVGEGAVWIADFGATGPSTEEVVVEQIDADTGRSVRVVHFPREVLGVADATWDMAAAGGSLWAGGSQGVLYRVDPGSGAIVSRIAVGKSIGAISVNDDTVWVGTNTTPGTVFGVDIRAGKITASISAGGGRGFVAGDFRVLPIRLAADNEHVWVTDAVNGTVSRVIALSGQASLPTDVGRTPTGVAVGLGSVWVTVEGK
jgi:DNA-binding beta-propeller fold protein YncE